MLYEETGIDEKTVIQIDCFLGPAGVSLWVYSLRSDSNK
jgi:hypothetical protein